MKYRPEIDGLRALAVTSVVLYHALPSAVRGGFVGVDVFFVISGYLITKILINDLSAGTFSIRNFYARRIKRIFPALVIVILATLVFGWFALLDDEFERLALHAIAGAGFVSNLLLWGEAGYFDLASDTKPLLHLWSLGVEEQFYLIWPIMLWLSRSRLIIAVMIGSVAAASFALNVAVVGNDPTAAFYSPLTRFWELLVGAILAWVHTHGDWKQVSQPLSLEHAGTGAANNALFGVMVNALSLLSLAALGFAFLYISDSMAFPGFWALLPTLATAMIIAIGSRSFVNRTVLSNRLCVWLGLISYPLYLWHWPILTYARIIDGGTPSLGVRLACIALSVLAAHLTYVLVEKHFRGPNRGKDRVVIPAASMVCLALASLVVVQVNGVPSRAIMAKNPSAEVTASFQGNPSIPCEVQFSQLDSKKWCHFYPVEGAERTIAVWGDSSSHAWSPVFRDVAFRKNVNLILITHPSCPPLLGARLSKFPYPPSRDYCSDGTMQAEVLSFLRSQDPESVFLLSAWNNYSPYSLRQVLTDDEREADLESTKRTLLRAVPETLGQLSAFSDVVVFKTWPMLPKGDIYPVRRIEILQPEFRVARVSVDEFRKDAAFINSILDQLGMENVTLFDPAEKMCTKVWCSTTLNRVRLYKDYYHISEAGSLQFSDQIEALFQQPADAAFD